MKYLLIVRRLHSLRQMDKTRLKLALDWTPNILHGGILLAQQRGYFEEAGVQVRDEAPTAHASMSTRGCHHAC
jgi:putative hydroxymethylpyrimidine transport system substrate-binding protein